MLWTCFGTSPNRSAGGLHGQTVLAVMEKKKKSGCGLPIVRSRSPSVEVIIVFWVDVCQFIAGQATEAPPVHGTGLYIGT